MPNEQISLTYKLLVIWSVNTTYKTIINTFFCLEVFLKKSHKYLDAKLKYTNIVWLITYNNCVRITMYDWPLTCTYLCKKKWWIPDPIFFYGLGNKRCHLLDTRKRKEKTTEISKNVQETGVYLTYQRTDIVHV